MTSVRLAVVLVITAIVTGLSLPAQAQSSIDINPNNSAGGGGDGSSPASFVGVGGTMFFSAEKDPNDGEEGWNLWKSDGTEAGTEKVKDIAPDNTNALVTPYTSINGTLYFTAADGTHGIELWKSDGTAGGTQMVKDIFSGAGSGPNCNIGSLEYAVFNGELFFDAEDRHDNCEIWKSDGTASGTELVANIRAGSSNPGSFTVAGNTLYFKAYTGSNFGTEIFRVTGGGTGVSRVTDLKNGPDNLTEAGGTLFFVHDAGNFNRKLYKIESGSATVVKDVESPSNLTEVGNTLFFAADGADGRGSRLWKSDGTTAGTQLVRSIPNTDQFLGEKLSKFTAVGSTLYFRKDAAGTTTAELWKSDGTTSGTIELVSGLQSIGEIGHLGSTVFFRASDRTHGSELWWSGGSRPTTQILKDLNAGSSNSYPNGFTAADGTLFFEATGGTIGDELWTSETTFQFVEKDVTVREDAGSTSLTVEVIAPPSGSSVSTDVTFDANASSASSGDVGNFGTTTVTFSSSASTGDTKTVSVPISGDGDAEGTETAAFGLTNNSAGTVIGTPSLFDLTILDDDLQNGDVLISEVMQNPSAVADDKGEYVELHNVSSSAKSVDGWTLENGAGTTTSLSNVTIPAQGFVVVCVNADSSANGGVNNCADDYADAFILNDDDDTLRLLNGSGTEVDRVDYDTGGNWPDPSGAAMVFTGATENNTADNWTTASRRERGYLSTQSGDQGSPGRNGTGQVLQPSAEVTGPGGWRMLSPPMSVTPGELAGVNLVQGVSGLPFSSGAPNLYQWTGGSKADWSAPSSGDDLTGGSTSAGGFIWYLFGSASLDVIDPPPFTLSLAGDTPNGDVSPSNLDADRTFHLLGNPYAQPYDVSGINLGAQGFSTTVQVWDPDLETYRLITQNDAGSDDILGPFQGFFVERVTGSNTTLTISASGRRADSIDLKRADDGPPRIALALTGRAEDGSMRTNDGALMVRAHPEASVGWDVHDASKLTPLQGRYATAAFRRPRDGKPSLQALASVPSPLPEDGVALPLSIQTQGADSVATFRLSWPTWENVPDHWGIGLYDAAADSLVNLRNHSGYTFAPGGAKAGSAPPPRSPLAVPERLRAKAQSDSARFELRLQAEPLPVEMAHFDATTSGDAATLTWTTASETDNAGFHVEHLGPNAERFEALGFVDGHGTTTTPQRYRFDTKPLDPGRHVFRLRQEDLDGTTTLSDTTAVRVRLAKKAQVRFAPNPVRTTATVSLRVRTEQDVAVALYDVLGRRVRTLHEGSLARGRVHQFQLDAQALSSGIYLLRVRGERFETTRRVTVTR